MKRLLFENLLSEKRGLAHAVQCACTRFSRFFNSPDGSHLSSVPVPAFRFFIIAAIALLFSTRAAAQDSMAQFRSFIENASPAAADMGGWTAPEIFAVNTYPAHPAPGDAVTVRAMVKTYSAMVGYKINSVSLTWWAADGEEKTVEMKLEDAGAGIYSAPLGTFKKGDDIFYTVRATDDWGNASIELPPDGKRRLVIEDKKDESLAPSMDISAVYAALDGPASLQLCAVLAAESARTVGPDMAAYGFFIFGRDVRYKPSQTETEMSNGWLAAYLPAFSISDLVPAADLADAFTPAGGGPKRAKFSKKDNRLCFTFDPSVIRSDAAMGLKITAVTLALNPNPLGIKPADTTHTIMLYPGVHSFMVR